MKPVTRDIEGYPGYQADTDGNIYGKKFNSPLAQSKGTKGYPHVCLYLDRKSHTRETHRIIAETFIPNPKNLKTVNHKNGNKKDNRVDNLEWMTMGDNILHAIHILGRRYGGGNRISHMCCPVLAMDKVSGYFSEHISYKSAAETLGICKNSISRAILASGVYGVNRQSTHLIWRLTDA